GHRHSDFTQFLDEDGLRSARIGVCRQFFGSHPAVDELMERAMAVLKSQGASLVELDKVPTFGQFGRDEYEIMLYEFKDGLDRYLAAVAPEMPVHSLEELIRFNERHAGRELAHFGQEHLQLAARKGPLTDTTYLEARARAAKLAGELGIDAVIGEHRLDALMAPTSGPAHVTDYVHGDRGLGGSSSPAAVAGYPSITIPAGDVRGLPVGLSLFGRAWSEPTLIRLAYSFEQATEHRRAPGFHPSIGA
ncbi:MAG TPA: amidase, partial [Verrucomicrobiales bacterium]|nr:amidase [Verrucomicrobiales bacterium]